MFELKLYLFYNDKESYFNYKCNINLARWLMIKVVVCVGGNLSTRM